MDISKISDEFKNFVFIGEAGSGKTECALNFAIYLSNLKKYIVDFFDLDMVKSLFRSRDMVNLIKNSNINIHFQEQYRDAPTQVGGVKKSVSDKKAYTVLDIGGDDIGARSIGWYANLLNNEDTIVFYVINVYRPWSKKIIDIDTTLRKILTVSHIQLGRIKIISNPNLGTNTTIEEFWEGYDTTKKLLSINHQPIIVCVNEKLINQSNFSQITDEILFPLHIYFSKPWLGLE